ncbi:hypothetical protein [Methylobacter tundripaludum]|uniref:hypothetical protein n=1 Tax=Methylobacter tundripaludum TaxID=173365 RepID=UPI0004DF58B6|nr:hypothetical protein [Methylobacter tundripaludum]
MHNKMAQLTLFSFILFSCNIVFAKEVVEIQFGALPDAVKKTTLDYIEKQHITRITKVTGEGLVKFEIETDKVENNKDIITQDIVIASNGKIMKLSQEVPYFSLPFEQMQEIEKRYPKIKVDEVESIQIHYFDVFGIVNGQKIKFRLFANGAIEEIMADPKKTNGQ